MCLLYIRLQQQQMLHNIVADKYKLIQKLAIGPFYYEVFKGQHRHNHTEVAIKLQKKSIINSKLYNQIKILKEIQGGDLTTDLGMPHVFENGTDGEFNYMVMDLLGTSLDNILVQKEGKFDIKMALEVGEQMLERIQTLHSRGYLHRDLRPEHFLYGRAKRPNRLYLTGLSIGKKYMRIDKKHADYKDNKNSFTGTARFGSLNAHMGIQQSRRDDIEALLYIIIYLIKGSLPWQKLKANKRYEKYQKILEVKLVTLPEVLCEGLPPKLQQLLRYTKLLEYEQIPDYEYMIKSLREARQDKIELIFNAD